MLIDRTHPETIGEPHTADDFIVIVIPPFDLLRVCRQMRVDEAESCFVQLKAYSYATLISLPKIRMSDKVINNKDGAAYPFKCARTDGSRKAVADFRINRTFYSDR